MSTQSIVTLENLPTDVAMGQYLAEKSVDLLKYLRFEIGCVDHDKLAEILRLQRLVCGNFCYVDDDQDRVVREAVIRNTITEIYEL
jgi:hypothetical protein